MLTVCDPVRKAGQQLKNGVIKMLAWIKTGTGSLGRSLASAAAAARDRTPSVCCADPLEAKRERLEKAHKEILGRLGLETLAISRRNPPSAEDVEMVNKLTMEAQARETELLEIRDAIVRKRQDREIDSLRRSAEADLKSPSANVRRVAVRVLDRVGKRETIPVLTAVLRDPDPDVRSSAAQTIHKLVEGKPG